MLKNTPFQAPLQFCALVLAFLFLTAATGDRITVQNSAAGQNRTWEIIEELGGGGFGTVYRVRPLGSTDSSQNKAVKVFKHLDARPNRLNPNYSQMASELATRQPQYLLGFDAPVEARVNVNNTQYTTQVMFMPLAGPSLETLRMNRQWENPHPSGLSGRAAAVERTVQFVSQGFRALQELRDLGWIHRDIDPPNFLLQRNLEDFDSGGRIVLIDFDLNRDFGREALVGRPGYLSPDWLQEAEESIASEYFSFGHTLYTLLFRSPLIEEILALEGVIAVTDLNNAMYLNRLLKDEKERDRFRNHIHEQFDELRSEVEGSQHFKIDYLERVIQALLDPFDLDRRLAAARIPLIPDTPINRQGVPPINSICNRALIEISIPPH